LGRRKMMRSRLPFRTLPGRVASLAMVAVMVVAAVPTGCVLADDGWHIETVDSDGDVGEASSLAFDLSGNPAISYLDRSNLDLKFVYDADGGGFEAGDIVTVDSDGDRGLWLSLALDASDNPAIAYGYYEPEASINDLMFAYDAGGDGFEAAEIVTVESIGLNPLCPDAYLCPSLAFDGSDHPAISYYDELGKDLKFAYDANGNGFDSGEIETVDTTGEVGQFSSLAFDGSGHPAISYFYRSTGDLKFVYDSDGDGLEAAEIVTVDSDGDVGWWTSLAFDTSGLPAISYYDRTNGDLKFARFVGFDWGDAPDSYGTRSVDDGPRHSLGADLCLGSLVDRESDGQPTADATGDDTDGSDDEDGVGVDGFVRPGILGSVDVTCSGSGYLNAWFDWNDDGDWDDDGEHALDDISVSLGTTNHSVTPPEDVSTTDVISRFRLSTDEGLSSTGPASDGEVEDHVIPVRLYDRGDAPESYGSARHGVTGIYMGAGVEPDTVEHYSADATGDDVDGEDDEDGVVFTSPLRPGQSASVDVVVSGAGKLSAWVDFDGSGSWDSADRVFNEVSLADGGTYSLTFSVPVVAVPGTTFARFRFHSANSNVTSPIGPTWNGEVEDYSVDIVDTITLDLKTGWNMVSVPLEPVDDTCDGVFQNAEAVYTWNPAEKSYVVPEAIEAQKGYWVAVATDMTIDVEGLLVEDWQDDLCCGWNMIGSVCDCSVPFGSPDTDPEGDVEGFAYWWDPMSKSYQYCTEIEPQKGYWVAATGDCTLSLHGSS